MEKETEILYLDALDDFLGLDHKIVNRAAWKKINLLKESHDEAKWFCQLFPEAPVTESEIVSTLYKSAKHLMDLDGGNINCESARALCYGAIAHYHRYGGYRYYQEVCDVLQKAANYGNSLAQYKISMMVTSLGNYDEASMCLIKKSALQNNRHALFELGMRYRDDRYSYANANLAKKAFKKSAELGYTRAMNIYAGDLSSDDPEKYYWYGKSAAKGCISGRFGIFNLMKQSPINDAVKLAKCWWGEIVFMAGKVLKGHVNGKLLYGFDYESLNPDLIFNAELAVYRYDQRCNHVRQSIYSWLIVANRLGYHFVNKDIALLIARLVWEGRGFN